LSSPPADLKRETVGIVRGAARNFVGRRCADRAHRAAEFQTDAGERMVAVEHHLVLGDVGDRVDRVVVLVPGNALEAHAHLELVGEPAAPLHTQQRLVVVAEGLLGLQPDSDARSRRLALERALERRQDLAIAAVQIVDRPFGALDQVALEVRQVEVDRDHPVAADVHQESCFTSPRTSDACPFGLTP
jgi:hypothetical protein